MSDANGHTTFSPDQLQLMSALVSRANLAARLGWTFSGDRAVHEVLGYKQALEFRDFKARYYRQDIANRIVKAYPEATWSQAPVVREDDEDEAQTPFEADWESLVARLGLFAILERADIQNNLGQYSVLFLGLSGQSVGLEQPARPVRGPDDVLYITPYSEEWIQIERFDGNPGSPTFGQPLLYRINFGRSGSGQTARTAMPVGTATVHASRVIHLAEDCLDDDVYGVPRLEPIYDRLDDLLKVVGGSAEMFWKDAKRRLALNLEKDAVLENAATLSEEVDEFMHGLRDILRVQGMNVQNLSGEVARPDYHVDVLFNSIAGATGIPKRILMGSERGELASTQDERAWLQRIVRRQERFAEPVILRQLIDRLIMLRALRAPVQPYTVAWPSLMNLTDEQRADVAQKTAAALNAYASGLANTVVPEPEFRETYLGLLPYPEVETLDLTPSDEEEPMGEDEA